MIRFFRMDISIIEHDPRAEQIQKDLDAEHYRQERSKRKVWYPEGVIAPRKLSESVAHSAGMIVE